MRLLGGGLASLLLTCSLSAQGFSGYVLDPKTYASPAGAVRLSVVPSRSSGGGPATYRCARGATELWAGERPWTLWDAVVTDEGVVAGYAYGAGYEGGGDDSFTIVVLAPDGSVRLEQRSERKGYVSEMGMPDPLVVGLLLDAESERVILRVRTGPWAEDETWWIHSLSSGTAEARIDPGAELRQDHRIMGVEEARLIPETGLALVRWRWLDWDARQLGAVFTLLDREGRLRWRLDWPTDHMALFEDEATWSRVKHELMTTGAILTTAPGRFTLRQVAANEQVTFAIDGSDVRELERRPHAGPEKTDPVAISRLDLRHLGTISLDLGRIARLALGPGDRIYAAFGRTGSVHVFGPDGTRERVCVPAPGDFDGEWSLLSLTVTDAGEVYLDKLLFAADGTPLCRVDLPGSRHSFSAYAQRGSDRMWVSAGDRLHLLASDGTPVRTIERAPDGKWLRRLGTAAVAPDGAIAITTFGHYDTGAAIHLYSAGGEPVRSIPAPDGMLGSASFAFDGERIAIGVPRAADPGAVVLLDELGTPLGRFLPPGATSLWVPYFAVDGAELWLLDPERSRIERYAMP